MNLESARRAGFDAVSVQVAQLDRAHFYPDKAMILLCNTGVRSYEAQLNLRDMHGIDRSGQRAGRHGNPEQMWFGSFVKQASLLQHTVKPKSP